MLPGRWRARIGSTAWALGLSLSRTPPYLALAHRFRWSPRFRRRVAPALMAPVARPAGPPRADGTRLRAIWESLPGGHKWHHYFPFYEEVLAPFLARPVRLLEIGVYNGASLGMWRAYLPEGSTVVGVDIDPACRAHDAPERATHVRIGDQSDPAFLARVVAEFGPFDVIVDDGSHVARHMIASFNALFLDGLRAPGVYLVEDTHTNYWATPYRDGRYSFVDFAKDLVDLLHAHHVTHRSEARFRLGDPRRATAIEVPRLAAEIGEIRFRDSLVAIARQGARDLPVNEHR